MTIASRFLTLWVNRKSGMHHRRRDCEALRGVPDAALRRVEVEPGQVLPVRARYCSYCAVKFNAD